MLFTFNSNHGFVSLGFRDIDDLTFSTSMTFRPLLVAKRPCWSVGSTFSMSFLLVFYSRFNDSSKSIASELGAGDGQI